MSRAMNIDASVAEVTEASAKAGVAISAIEKLVSTGTHVVYLTSNGADEMRRKFRNKVMTGPITRMPNFVRGNMG